MVVTSFFGNSLVECEWVSKEKVYRHSFRPESLILSTITSEIQIPKSIPLDIAHIRPSLQVMEAPVIERSKPKTLPQYQRMFLGF